MKNKSSLIIFGILGAILVAFFTWAIIYKQSNTTDISAYDINKIIEDTSESGGIGEHIEGNPDAEIVIIEYSDFQCSGCASVVDKTADLIKKYDGKVAVVHRSYVLSYHENGLAAASAAEAAGLQGYWKPYGEYLFSHQDDWYYSDATTRTDQFVKYFDTVTEGKGDKEKFLADYASEAVKTKVNFDLKIAKSIAGNIQYTPAFFLDGKLIDFAYDNPDNLSFVDYFSKKIDEKLAK